MFFSQRERHFLNIFGQRSKKIIQQFRGTVYFALGEENLAAVFFYNTLLCPYVTGHIIFCMGVLLPFCIDIRLHIGDNLMNSDRLTQKNVVHNFKA